MKTPKRNAANKRNALLPFEREGRPLKKTRGVEDYFARTERHICEIKRALDVDKARATLIYMAGGASVIARDSRAGAGGPVCTLTRTKPIAGENLCGADGEAGEGREGGEREENGRIRALIMR